MIELELKAEPSLRLDLAGILPETLLGLREAEILRRAILHGGRSCALGDWFSLRHHGETEPRLGIAGACAQVDHIGAGMGEGEIIVEGDAGAYVGAFMRGGRIIVRGSAGYGAAIAMAGGELRIDGNAGNELGGALPGERSGMREGVVLVAGDAGSRVADRMRRGIIAVRGSVGPFCGSRMIAGTVVVGGGLGTDPGIAMRRGSIIALGGTARLPRTFIATGREDPVFLRLLATALNARDFGEIALEPPPFRRWVGDLAEGGRGEIFTRP